MDKFWNNAEKEMQKYLLANIERFKKVFIDNPAIEKDKEIDTFLAGLEGKDNFESLFNYVKGEILELFNTIKNRYLVDGQIDKLEENKIRMIVAISQLFNSVLPIPRFLDEFLLASKSGKGPIDFNDIFNKNIESEINEICKIYDEILRGKDESIDETVDNIKNSKLFNERIELIERLGIFLQRDTMLKTFDVSNAQAVLDKQVKELHDLFEKFKASEDSMKFSKEDHEKAIFEITKYHEFVVGMNDESRQELAKKAEEFRGVVVPLVNIILSTSDLSKHIINAIKQSEADSSNSQAAMSN